MDGHGSAILLFLVQVAIILALSRAMGLALGRLRQPQVIGEMLAGIMLGPSLLGWLAPSAAAALFPPQSMGIIQILSQLGVIFFLFLVGLEFDPRLVQRRSSSAISIAGASIVVPFMLGVGLTAYLYPRIFDRAGPQGFWPSALFMGAAVSVTAFPVLARILTERNLHRTEVGAMTTACAAINDLVAWCILAFVVAFANARGFGDGLRITLWSALYVGAMFLLVHPFLLRLERVYDRQGYLAQGLIAIIFLLLLASSWATEWIGIHAMFGAFLLGAIMPNGTRFVRHLTEKLEDFTVVLLLPVFFAYTGLHTDLSLLNSASMWGYALLVVAAACLGKVGGAMLMARFSGVNWAAAGAIGILMNTRGLMELVILTVGRQLGVINDTVFGMMIIMALVTTAMTAPLLQWIYPGRQFRTLRVGNRPSERRYSILVPLSLPKSARPLLHVAEMLGGEDATRRSITALHLRPSHERDAYAVAADEPIADPALESAAAAARELGISIETTALVRTEVAADIAQAAQDVRADLVLMGFHKPVIGTTILGGTVHRVLRQVQADVAVYVDRGLHQVQRVLVPYLGSPHDRFAIELAGRLARHARAALTVLYVVPPGRGAGDSAQQAGEIVHSALGTDKPPHDLSVKVVEDSAPVDAVLRGIKGYDLVVIGVAEQWGLESALFGWKSERIARDSSTALLIVRKWTPTDP